MCKVLLRSLNIGFELLCGWVDISVHVHGKALLIASGTFCNAIVVLCDFTQSRNNLFMMSLSMATIIQV